MYLIRGSILNDDPGSVLFYDLHSIYKILYGAVHTARSAELHAYWKRYSIFATVNFLFLGLSLDTFKESKIMLLILCGFGLVLCYFWILVIYLSKRHIEDRWDHCIYNLEKKFLEKLGLKGEEISDYLPLIKARDFEHKPSGKSSFFVRNWINMNFVALILPFICALTWFIVTIFKINELFKRQGLQGIELFIFGWWVGIVIFILLISFIYGVRLLINMLIGLIHNQLYGITFPSLNQDGGGLWIIPKHLIQNRRRPVV